MARRPDDWMVDVELLDEEADADASDDVAVSAGRATGIQGADTSGAGRPRRLRLPEHPGRWAAALAASAVAFAAVSIVVGLAGRQPDAGLDLGRPLSGRWTLPTGTVLGTADGVVAVRSTSVVAGYAVDDGRRLWEVRLGVEGPVDECAPAVTVDPATLWCWRANQTVRDALGGRTQRDAALVGIALADGTVTTDRATDVPWGGMLAVGADLVLGDRIREHLTLTRVSPGTWETHWTTELVLDPDPVTGDVRATVEVESGLVVVHGPTVAVLDAGDGGVLRWVEPSAGAPADMDAADVAVTEGGFGIASTVVDGARTEDGVWYDARGREVVGYTGVLAEPSVSDGSEPGVLVVVRGGVEVAGVDAATGRDLWVFPAEEPVVVARHDGAVTFAAGETLRSVELLTGWERWSATVEGMRATAGIVSDGDVAVTMAIQGRAWVFVAYDLAGGDRLWFARAAGTPDLDDLFYIGGPPRLTVLGDHTVVESSHGLTWLG